MPRTTRPSAASARIPATLRPPTQHVVRMLHGRLDVRPAPRSPPPRPRRRRARARAGVPAARRARARSRRAGSIRPARPKLRPRRPRPSVCSSVATTAPSRAPSSSRWVDAQLSTNVYGRPNRPRRCGTHVALPHYTRRRVTVAAPLRAGDNRSDPPAPPPVPAARRGRRARAGRARRRAQARDRRGLRRALSRATRSCPA